MLGTSQALYTCIQPLVSDLPIRLSYSQHLYDTPISSAYSAYSAYSQKLVLFFVLPYYDFV